MNDEQEPPQPLPFIPASMCTCNCTCKSVKSRKAKSIKRIDLTGDATGNRVSTLSPVNGANNGRDLNGVSPNEYFNFKLIN